MWRRYFSSGSGTQTSGRSKATIALYISVVAFFWIALYLYAPTLPVFALTKTDKLALVGLILSMYGLWQAIVRFPLGIFADWIGWQKPLILIGLLLAGLGALLMGASNGVNGLILGRAITGLAAGTWVPMVIVFSSFFPNHQAVRATTLLTLVGSISRLLATSVTGFLNNLGGYPLAFFLAAIVSALASLLILPFHETRRKLTKPSSRNIRRLMTRRDVLIPSLLNALTQYIAMASTFGFIPILAQRLGADHITQSMLVTSNLVALIVGNLAATAVTRRLTHRVVLTAGFLIMTAGTGMAGWATSLTWIFFAQLTTGLAIGLSYPILMGLSIENVADTERSTAMGLHQSIYGVGMFIGPWLSGNLADAIGVQAMFGLTALVCLGLGISGVHILFRANVRIKLG